MQAQAQAFQAPQNHAALNGKALRASYRYHNPILLTPEQVADLGVLIAWNGIAKEMAQALPTSNPYRKPLALLQDTTPSAPAPSIDALWGEIIPAFFIPALDIAPLPPVSQDCNTGDLIETQIDLMKGRAISPSCKSNLIDGWLEGRASWGEVKAAHKPKQTYTQRLVKRAYAVLSFVGGYARVR